MFERKQIVIFLWTIATLMFISTSLFAQSANLTGTIKDPTGAVLPGVSMTVKNTGTGLTRTVLTNETGDYTFPLLPIGSYEISAEFPGFKTQVKSGITLNVDDRLRVDFALEVGDISERVVVTEAAPLVQSENASIGNVIDNNKIVQLPLDGREFYSLAQLNPAVYAPAQGSTVGFRGGFNVAGASEIANNYSLDGIENMDPTVNQPAHRPSIDTIQEFKVLTGTYSAEYGRHSGGQIIVTTKSGTNQVHGTAFNFYRNSAMDARNYFASQIAPFQRNNFGGTIGGPIAKDRTHFFGGYEGTRANEQVTELAAVPDAAMRNGDFSGFTTPIRDPVTNQPFPGNIIPAERINRVSRELIRIWYPLPNISGPRNFRSGGDRTITNDQFNIRLDHKVSDANTLSGGYQFMNLRPYEPLGSISLCGSRVLPGLGCTDKTKTQAAYISNVHIINNNMIHELRVGYTRLTALRVPDAGTAGISQRLAIPGLPGASFPYNQGGPQVSISGFATLGPSSGNPQGRSDNTYHIVDTLAINRGTHSMKMGADLRYFQFNSFHAAGRPGQFSFNGFMTVMPGRSADSTNAFADFLLGFPRTAQRNTGVPFTVSTDTSYNFFFQDDWKVSERWSINAGIRYEYNRPIRERADHLASFDHLTGMLRVARCGSAFIDAGNNLIYTPGNCENRHIYESDKNNWAPRIGIAWRPLADNTFVVRMGYGVYYNLTPSGNGLSGLFRGLPFRIQTTQTAAQSAPIRFEDPFTPVPGQSSARFTQPSIDHVLATPYVQQYSLGLQKELSSSLMLETTYMGSLGTKLLDSLAINQPTPGPGSVDSRRPFQPWGSVSFSGPIARSWYNSLQIKADKRMAEGVSGLISYTWGKSIDTGAGLGTGSDGDAGNQDPRNYRLDSKGLSGFDVRHRFVSSFVLELPIGTGRRFLNSGSRIADFILGGWQVSGILTLQTGTPFTPTITNDNSNTGTTNRPHLVGNPKLDNPTPEQWFNKDAFCWTAACGLAQFTFGNAGRNILIGPPRKNLDFSLNKDFQIRENQRLQFRGEFFNLTNHPNFFLPNAQVNTSQGGTIGQAEKGRTVQLGLKYIF